MSSDHQELKIKGVSEGLISEELVENSVTQKKKIVEYDDKLEAMKEEVQETSASKTKYQQMKAENQEMKAEVQAAKAEVQAAKAEVQAMETKIKALEMKNEAIESTNKAMEGEFSTHKSKSCLLF